MYKSCLQYDISQQLPKLHSTRGTLYVEGVLWLLLMVKIKILFYIILAIASNEYKILAQLLFSLSNF